MYSGMIVACGGSTMVEIRIMKRIFFPGILKRANPYATMMHEISVPIVLIMARIKVLRNNSVKSTWVDALVKFSSVGAKLNTGVSVRYRPFQLNTPLLGCAGSTK